MTIGIDAGCLGIKDERLKVGVYQVAVNLFQELWQLDSQNIYLLYSFYPIDKNLLKMFGENVKNIVIKPARGWTKIWLPLQLLKDKPDIFIGLNQSLPLRLPTQTYKSIVMIHDVLFEAYPKLYPESFHKLHKETKSAVKSANVIIVPSDATKKDVEKYYGVFEKKITAIHEGIREFPKISNIKYPIPNIKYPYFLFVGALKPQKNVPMLLRAFGKILDTRNTQYPISSIQLLLVGGDKWKNQEIDKALKTLPFEVKERIHFLGTVNDIELSQLYKHALAFVSPSLSEGFGLPFLEAMSFGIPVIGPKAGAVPEVVGDAGILIDPISIEEIVNAMKKMINPQIRLGFQKKTKVQSKKFSWEKFAKKFLYSIQALS